MQNKSCKYFSKVHIENSHHLSCQSWVPFKLLFFFFFFFYFFHIWTRTSSLNSNILTILMAWDAVLNDNIFPVKVHVQPNVILVRIVAATGNTSICWQSVWERVLFEIQITCVVTYYFTLSFISKTLHFLMFLISHTISI